MMDDLSRERMERRLANGRRDSEDIMVLLPTMLVFALALGTWLASVYGPLAVKSSAVVPPAVPAPIAAAASR